MGREREERRKEKSKERLLGCKEEEGGVIISNLLSSYLQQLSVNHRDVCPLRSPSQPLLHPSNKVNYSHKDSN